MRSCPIDASGARSNAPIMTPQTIAVAAAAKLSPSAIGRVPSSTVAVVRTDPVAIRRKSHGGVDVRASGGIGSTPYDSIRGGTSLGGE